MLCFRIKEAGWSTNSPSDLPHVLRDDLLSYKPLFSQEKNPYALYHSNLGTCISLCILYSALLIKEITMQPTIAWPRPSSPLRRSKLTIDYKMSDQ